MDQSVEIDDTLFCSSIYHDFYRFHFFNWEDTSCSLVRQKMKIELMQTVNLLTIALQSRVEGSNNYR